MTHSKQSEPKQSIKDQVEGRWHKSKCQWADSDYSIVCDCHMVINNLLEAYAQQEVNKVLETERRVSLQLSNDAKLDRMLALAEKKGYEKCLEDQKRNSVIQDHMQRGKS